MKTKQSSTGASKARQSYTEAQLKRAFEHGYEAGLNDVYIGRIELTNSPEDNWHDAMSKILWNRTTWAFIKAAISPMLARAK
jgi:hypothetical protein